MNQILATNKTYVAEHWRVDYRNAILGQLPEGQQKLRLVVFPTNIHRFHPDWFALRL